MPDQTFSRAPIDERCRAVLEQLLDALLLVDVESGGILFANQAAADTCGRTREELARLRIFDLHHPCGSEPEGASAAHRASIEESGPEPASWISRVIPAFRPYRFADLSTNVGR